MVDRTPNPVLFLSSAGVGRTGVFITLSIVLERMRYEGVVDMFQTVKTLRTQRPAMVQTEVRGPPGRHTGICHQHWPLPALPGTLGQEEGNALIIWPLRPWLQLGVDIAVLMGRAEGNSRWLAGSGERR